MLRDRIVVRIKDGGLSKKLQMDPDLTLERAKKVVRQSKAIEDNQRQLQGDRSLPEPLQINSVSRPFKLRRSRPCAQTPPKGNTSHYRNPGSKQSCSRCGHSRHTSGEKCPAFKATCHKCKKKGHYSSKCFTKTVASTQELSLNTAF